jgi:hypothetical protein
MELSPRINIGLRILRSFFTNAKKTGKPRCLKLKLHRQWATYSCTAAVAQMVAHYYGFNMSHREAIKLTQCHPDGASLAFVARMLKKQCALSTKSLHTRAEIRSALKRGEPVMGNDGVNYGNNHAILLIGETPKGFYVADPAVCEIFWRHEDQVITAGEEFIAVRA